MRPLIPDDSLYRPEVVTTRPVVTLVYIEAEHAQAVPRGEMVLNREVQQPLHHCPQQKEANESGEGAHGLRSRVRRSQSASTNFLASQQCLDLSQIGRTGT